MALLVGLAGVAVGGSAVAITGAPVSVVIVVPIAVPTNTAGLVAAETLALYTSPQGLLSKQLDAVIDRPVAIALDPMILASIRVLGSSAPESALAWLERLRQASNETFPLPYANSDLTLATQAGSASILVPEQFDFAVDPALFAEPTEQTGAPTGAPTQTPDSPTIPALPIGDELIEWPYTFPALGWPRANSVISSDLAPLTNAFDSVIVASGNVSLQNSSPIAVELEGMKALLANDAVSANLAAAAIATSNEAWLKALGQLSDAVDEAGSPQSGEPVVIAAIDGTTALNGARLAETLSALASTSGVVLAPLSTVMSSPPEQFVLVDKPQPGLRVATMRQLLEAATAERDFATILAVPSDITAPRRLELLALSSIGWQATSTGWSVATQNFLDQSQEILGAVQIVESSSFNLLADNATLPIVVANDLDFAVTVYITVKPGTGLLAVGDARVGVLVEPNAQAKGQIPVTAISNGTVRAIVTLSSEGGVAIGDPTVAKINVQAGWETPVVVVLASIVVAIFAFGLVRSVLRRRNPVEAAHE